MICENKSVIGNKEGGGRVGVGGGRERLGEGVELRHWRPANVDESCLAHPCCHGYSKEQHACVCLPV